MPPEDNNQIKRTRSAANLRVININENHEEQNGDVAQGRISHLQPNQIQHRLRNPLLIHPATFELNQVHLEQPVPDQIETAYDATGFEYATSEKKARSLLDEGMKKYNLQVRLHEKENQAMAAHININVKTAISLSDEKLVQKYGEYHGEGMSYINTRYHLMRNKYYALLPMGEMKKLDRSKLLEKLRSEYSKNPRNPELITFYEDLVRIKIMEDEQDETKKDRPNPENPPVRITEKEFGDNRKAFNKNMQLIDGLPITDDKKMARKSAMKSVMQPENNNELWSEHDARHISPAQKEGLRSILAWMYRNCNKSSESKEPFVYKLTQAKPEQLLVAFYLVENKMQYAPNQECIHKAMTGYIPDLATFKDRMVATKAKFWKRFKFDSSDSVIYWSKLGMAARFALNSDALSDYLRFTEEEDRIKDELDQPDNAERREELINDLLLQKGNLLLTLYRAAGLSPDMPSDLIEEPSMRQKVDQIIADFNLYLGQLHEIALIREGKDFDTGAKLKKAKGKGIADPSLHHGAMPTIDHAKAYVSGAMSFTALSEFIGGSVKEFTGTDNFKLSSGGIGTVCSIVGLLNSFIGMINLGKGANLTGADHLSQGLSVGSRFVGSLNATTNGTAKFLNQLGLIDMGKIEMAENLPWYGSTDIMTANQSFSTVAGGFQFVSGAIGMLTGTATATSGIVDISRGVSSRNDLKRARAAKRRELTAQNGQERVLTEKERAEREQLERLMNHQDRAITNQEFSGTLKAIGGTLTAVGGFFTMTGILAPIGGILSIAGTIVNIGLGMLYARHRRHLTQRQAVDDALKLDEAVERVQNEIPGYENLNKKQKEKLKNQVRQEAMGELGYATYKEAFSEISKQNAALLYEKVFTLREGTEEHNMYFETLKSMGFKIKKAGPGQKEAIPTMQMIYSKLMG